MPCHKMEIHLRVVSMDLPKEEKRLTSSRKETSIELTLVWNISLCMQDALVAVNGGHKRPSRTEIR